MGTEVAILEMLQGNQYIVRIHDTFEDAKVSGAPPALAVIQ